MPTLSQKVLGAAQFTGLAGAGEFDFAFLDLIPRTTRVVISAVSYFEPAGPPFPPMTNVDVWADLIAVDVLQHMPFGRGLAAENLLSPITGNAELRLCGLLLPRVPGDGGAHYQVRVVTENKTHDAVVLLDYYLCPFNETTLRDSHEV